MAMLNVPLTGKWPYFFSEYYNVHKTACCLFYKTHSREDDSHSADQEISRLLETQSFINVFARAGNYPLRFGGEANGALS
jgi:hypothetical protein